MSGQALCGFTSIFKGPAPIALAYFLSEYVCSKPRAVQFPAFVAAPRPFRAPKAACAQSSAFAAGASHVSSLSFSAVSIAAAGILTSRSNSRSLPARGSAARAQARRREDRGDVQSVRNSASVSSFRSRIPSKRKSKTPFVEFAMRPQDLATPPIPPIWQGDPIRIGGETRNPRIPVHFDGCHFKGSAARRMAWRCSAQIERQICDDLAPGQRETLLIYSDDLHRCYGGQRS